MPPSIYSSLCCRCLATADAGVRRAAYRAVSSLDAGALATICESWALTNEGEDAVELRERAAEAAAWLPEELRSPQIEALATDPEPTVRQAYKSLRSRAARARVGRDLRQPVMAVLVG